MQKTLLFIFSLIIISISAQEYNPIALPNTYQSTYNPLYWKNKKPFTDYWQQDVYYKMDVVIDEKTDIIHGKEKLTYWNNSPDTLNFVYFHLYANQAVKGSYLSKQTEANGGTVSYGKYQEKGLGLEILSMQVNGNELKTEEDNTILKVYLDEPLLPNSSTTFDIIFKNYYDNGSLRRRMKMYKSWGKKHYNGAHWYPRIAAYDRKFGWTTDQHMGREFYADFGTFDVSLTFANDFIVTATGFLLNREEMYPKELWEQLKVANFKDKPWNEKPSTIIEREEGKRKTWHFYAENIHDFAFVADPLFRIGEAEWNGKKAYSFVQEPHASKWQNAAEYTAKILKVFSTDFGMYGWHKMIVADAKSGMEYPMLTMDNGSEPGYRDLLVHEVGHNWFFGMMNNNETYRALMDEGFTQFLTAWGMEAIDGKYEVEKEPKNWYVKKFKYPVEARERRVYVGYTRSAATNTSAQLNTHSDKFTDDLDHGWNYWQVYSKTATMLYNLQYTLGDSLFLDAMQYYFDKWSFCHPYPEDFRKSIIEYTHSDLNWFFDQWLETTKTLDYKLTRVLINDSIENSYDITFKRKGQMQMPIDFQVTDKAGNKYDYYVPNTYFEKKTKATTLPKWTGWNTLNREYTATVNLPISEDKKVGVLKNVVIDPTDRLGDRNMTNNRLNGNIDWYFDSHINNLSDRKKYRIYWRPDIWWNAFDGIKIGNHLRGSYINTINKFDLWYGFNTRLLQADLPFKKAKHYNNGRFFYRFNYSTPLNDFIPFSNIKIQSRYLDGLALNMIKVSKTFKKNVVVGLAVKSMIRPEKNDNNYLLSPKEWDTQKWNNKIILDVKHYFRFNKNRARASIKAEVMASVFSDYQDFAINLEYLAKESIKRLDFKFRAYGVYSPSSFSDSKESSLFLAGANPEEMMDNKYVRATGFFPTQWVGTYGNTTNHFHYGGGLNLRGYAGNAIITKTYRDSVNYTFNKAYSGNSGLAFNFEVGFDRIIKFKKIPKFFKNFDFDMYLFGDVGLMSYDDRFGIERILLPRGDAGIGTTFTIKKFGPLQKIKPLVIRFDMPFFVSHPSANEKSFKFRWVLGINRAF